VKRRAAFLAGVLLLGGGTAAIAAVVEATYVCERGVHIPVVYVNEVEAENIAILHVDGRLITLPQARAASGALYAEPDAWGYSWWSRGTTATLAWFDTQAGEEVTLFALCDSAE
jgi:membrane-bound inhibitor of C-type lysozyme